MRQLLYTLILPLTLILFGTVTKWWSVSLVDAPDDVMLGFSLPYVCSGWHTSLSLQIFILESGVDMVTYYLFTWTIIFMVNRFVTTIIVSKLTVIILYGIAAVFVFFFAVIALNPDNIFYWRNPLQFNVMETGIRFILQKF